MLMRRAIVLAGIALALTPVAGGTPPGANGRVAFLRLEAQNGPLTCGLWVIASDRSRSKRVTRPTRGTVDGNPDWSPDGSRIVFTRQPSTGAYSIWTVRGSGASLRRVSPPCPPGDGIPRCAADDSWPVWSPDGKHLVFQRLTGAVRPSGATINNATAIYKDELVVTDVDGAHVHTVVWLGPWRGDPQSPAWSP